MPGALTCHVQPQGKDPNELEGRTHAGSCIPQVIIAKAGTCHPSITHLWGPTE